jgi:hypothetical protein
MSVATARPAATRVKRRITPLFLEVAHRVNR